MGPSPPTEASYSAGFRDFKALIFFGHSSFGDPRIPPRTLGGVLKKELESRDQ